MRFRVNSGEIRRDVSVTRSQEGEVSGWLANVASPWPKLHAVRSDDHGHLRRGLEDFAKAAWQIEGPMQDDHHHRFVQLPESTQ